MGRASRAAADPLAVAAAVIAAIGPALITPIAIAAAITLTTVFALIAAVAAIAAALTVPSPSAGLFVPMGRADDRAEQLEDALHGVAGATLAPLAVLPTSAALAPVALTAASLPTLAALGLSVLTLAARALAARALATRALATRALATRALAGGGSAADLPLRASLALLPALASAMATSGTRGRLVALGPRGLRRRNRRGDNQAQGRRRHQDPLQHDLPVSAGSLSRAPDVDRRSAAYDR